MALPTRIQFWVPAASRSRPTLTILALVIRGEPLWQPETVSPKKVVALDSQGQVWTTYSIDYGGDNGFGFQLGGVVDVVELASSSTKGSKRGCGGIS